MLNAMKYESILFFKSMFILYKVFDTDVNTVLSLCNLLKYLCTILTNIRVKINFIKVNVFFYIILGYCFFNPSTAIRALAIR